jgi:DNA-binding GntR family transcriptional regulator
VSRGTVREAFRMLTKDDLLVQHDSSLFVYNPGAQDILDIYECRKSLESLAATLATNNITNEQLEQLKLIIENSKEALKINNTPALIQFNQQFHDIIALASQNKQLIQLFEVISAKVLYIRNCILRDRPESFEDLVNDHERIYIGLKERNVEKAAEEMRLHIQRSLEIASIALNDQMDTETSLRETNNPLFQID